MHRMRTCSTRLPAVAARATAFCLRRLDWRSRRRTARCGASRSRYRGEEGRLHLSDLPRDVFRPVVKPQLDEDPIADLEHWWSIDKPQLEAYVTPTIEPWSKLRAPGER